MEHNNKLPMGHNNKLPMYHLYNLRKYRDVDDGMWDLMDYYSLLLHQYNLLRQYNQDVVEKVAGVVQPHLEIGLKQLEFVLGSCIQMHYVKVAAEQERTRNRTAALESK